MQEKILSFHNFNCPQCNSPFNEDSVMELCGEPYSGCILHCFECDSEFSADLLIKLEYLGKEE